jgi:leucyl-tRNA synthetase
VRHSRDDLAQRNQAVRIRVGQRPQQNAVHEREDRRIGADTESQDQDGDCAEPRIAELLEGATVRTLKVVPGKIVNFVIA